MVAPPGGRSLGAPEVILGLLLWWHRCQAPRRRGENTTPGLATTHRARARHDRSDSYQKTERAAARTDRAPRRNTLATRGGRAATPRRHFADFVHCALGATEIRLLF
jgi:hypothetical protein